MLKTKDGITLVALVITIIIMLILIGVIIAIALNGRLFEFSKNAVDQTKAELEKENDLDRGKLAIGDEEFESTEEYVKGKNIRNTITPAPTGDTYSPGDEVTLGEEQFFVLSDTGTELRILAKYCLSKIENIQLTKDNVMSDYARNFSSTNYWKDDFTSRPFNLQGDYLKSHLLSVSETEGNNAILKAKTYGMSKKVVGELMSYEEVNDIKNGNDDNMKNIIWGRWTDESKPKNGYLNWWLGDAYSSSYLYAVYGVNKNITILDCEGKVSDIPHFRCSSCFSY